MVAMVGPHPLYVAAAKPRRYDKGKMNMPMHWRRVVDSAAFFIALGVAVWMRYWLDSTWFAAIAVGLLVFAVTPFIALRALAKHLERAGRTAK
jgi:hypothetical protein